MSSIPVTPKYGNHSRTLSAGTKAPFSNSTSYSLSEGCLTHYSPLITTVCATILQGIATSINITACSQPVTFSSQYGYVLSIPPGNISTMTPSPVVQTQTTYWVAPWQALTAGLTPANVTERICSAVPSIGAGNIAVNETQCVDINEVWQTTIVTILTSTISHIDLTTTIPGPSQLMIETFHADITETMTELSLSTRMVLVYSTESVSTSISTVATASGVITGPTVSQTMTLINAPSHGHVTSTVTRLLTSTIYSGTKTTTVMSHVPSSSSVLPFSSNGTCFTMNNLNKCSLLTIHSYDQLSARYYLRWLCWVVQCVCGQAFR